MDLSTEVPAGSTWPLKEKISWIAVFDGHGGDFASQWLSQRLHKAFVKALLANSKQTADLNERIKTALLEAHRETDKELLAAQAEERRDDGACAVVVLCVSTTPRTVWVANVGDCKAVLARTRSKIGEVTTLKAHRLTKEHSPLLLEERKRIETAGGRVEDSRVNGILGVSRSFGDPRYKKLGVISVPDIAKFSLSVDERFLLIACDGLWTVLNPDTAVSYLKTQLQEAWQYEVEHPTVNTEVVSLRKESPAQAVCRKAVTKLVTHAVMEQGAKDNTTAVVICFEHDGQPYTGLPKEILQETASKQKKGTAAAEKKES